MNRGRAKIGSKRPPGKGFGTLCAESFEYNRAVPRLPFVVDRTDLLDVFVERSESLVLAWRGGTATVRRGFRWGAAARWALRGGAVHLRSFDAPSAERIAAALGESHRGGDEGSRRGALAGDPWNVGRQPSGARLPVSEGPGTEHRGALDAVPGTHVEDPGSPEGSPMSELDLTAFIEDAAFAVSVAMRGSGQTAEVEGEAHAYGQDVRVETATGPCGDVRGGVWIELRGRVAGRGVLRRRAADRTLAALRMRVSPEDFGAELGRSLLLQRETPFRPDGTLPVIFAGRDCGALLHEIGHLFEEGPGGDQMHLGRPGDAVGPSGLTVIDDPRACSGRGSYAVDDEGFPPAAAVLIEEGRLAGSLPALVGNTPFRRAPRTSSPQLAGVNGGHARRASYLDAPLPRMSCTYLAAGPEDPAAILRETMRGLFVRSLRWGRLNPVTGQVTLVVSEGSMIENGRATRPISECIIVSSARDLLRSIDAIGSDLEFDRGVGNCVKSEQQVPVMVGLPTIRIGLVRVLAP